MTVRVGSWPGPSFDGNDFIQTYCQSLSKQGIVVVDLNDPADKQTDDIDILQIHWPEKIFWTTSGLGAARAILQTLKAIRNLRAKGVKIAWLVHNLKPHDSSIRKRWLWRFYSRPLARMTDAILSLSPATLPIIERALPFPAKVAKLALRHPFYRPKTEAKERSMARQEWDVPDDRISLVFVGLVRPYKGVLELARLVKAQAKDTLHLSIAGHTPLASYQEQLTQLCDATKSVSFKPGRVEDEDFECLVACADFVVLPFVDTLHSGSIVHALSLGRAVLTPRTPYAEDLQRLVGEEWLRLYDGALAQSHFDELKAAPSGQPDLTPLSPELMGEQLAHFYETLVKSN